MCHSRKIRFAFDEVQDILSVLDRFIPFGSRDSSGRDTKYQSNLDGKSLSNPSSAFGCLVQILEEFTVPSLLLGTAFSLLEAQKKSSHMRIEEGCIDLRVPLQPWDVEVDSTSVTFLED